MLELDLHDLPQMLTRQAMEEDDLIHSVQEFWPELLPQGFHHPTTHFFLVTAAELTDILATNVRGHDDHGVLKVHRTPLAVREAPLIQDLQEHVKDLGVRLFDLIKEHDGIRVPAHGLCELAALIISHITGWRTDHSCHSVPFLVFAHVQPNHGALVIEQELCQRPSQFRLAHTGGTEEDKGANRPVWILQTRA